MLRNKLQNFYYTKSNNERNQSMMIMMMTFLSFSRSPLGLDHSGQMIVISHLSENKSRHSILTNFTPSTRSDRTSIVQMSPHRFSRQRVHQILKSLITKRLRNERTAKQSQQWNPGRIVETDNVTSFDIFQHVPICPFQTLFVIGIKWSRSIRIFQNSFANYLSTKWTSLSCNFKSMQWSNGQRRRRRVQEYSSSSLYTSHQSLHEIHFNCRRIRTHTHRLHKWSKLSRSVCVRSNLWSKDEEHV